MKIYEIELKPTSAFISSICGDMLFGALCWQIQNAGFGLSDLLKGYDKSPFMVVSSGFYKSDNEYQFPRPALPSFMLFKDETQENKKNNAHKKFFSLFDNEIPLNISNLEFYKDDNLIPYSQQHNTIDRIKGIATPFYTESFVINKNIVVFVALDENRFSKENLITVFEYLGKNGFGKKSSSGYGHFSVVSCKESILWNKYDNCNYFYSLSPFVLSDIEKQNVNKIYFNPITKYGKHGDVLAMASNPFKNPVIMADTASMISLKITKEYMPFVIGKALTEISTISKETVAQGYALCLPCILEDKNDN